MNIQYCNLKKNLIKNIKIIYNVYEINYIL